MPVEILPWFEGFSLRPLDPEEGGKNKWARAHREPMGKSQAELKDLVTTEAARGKSAQEILNSKDLIGLKKNQIDRLIQEHNLSDRNPNLEWRQCFIK